MIRKVCAAFLLFFSSSFGLAEEDEKGFTPLFNGKDLSGWVNVSCAPSTWKFDDKGLLICSGKPVGEIRTDRMYQNFIMELEWRHMVPAGNAGVFVWADDITARGQPFIKGVEVQILDHAYGNTKGHTTHGDIFPIHGAKMKPVNGRGGSRAFPTENRSKPSPEWNHYRIECQDGNISLAVNGKVVTQGTDSIPRKGYICLESEGGVVHYRNVRVKELPDTPINPDHVAQEDRGFFNLYSGVDLSGWKPSHDNWKSRNWFIAFADEKDKESPSAKLSSLLPFGDVHFIFDVRRLPKTKTVSFLPRGMDGAAVEIGPENQKLAAMLVKEGGWNRIEGSIKGRVLSLKVNGTLLEDQRMPKDFPEEGPLTFEANGPVEITSIYVRPAE